MLKEPSYITPIRPRLLIQDILLPLSPTHNYETLSPTITQSTYIGGSHGPAEVQVCSELKGAYGRYCWKHLCHYTACLIWNRRT